MPRAVTGVEVQYAKHFLDLPKVTRRALAQLNNVADGHSLSSMDRYSSNPEMYYSLRTFVARKGKRIVGWAVARSRGEFALDGYEIDVYIKPEFRRRGYGSLLIKAVRSKLKKRLIGSKWSDASDFFFSSLNIKDW